MPKNIKITEARRPTPDAARLVHALLLLARAKAEAPAKPSPEARRDDSR